jgi:type VI protein secretion system component VasK
MNHLNLAVLMLRVRIAVLRLGLPACIALTLGVAGVLCWALLLPRSAAQARVMAQPLPAPSTLVAPRAPQSANQHLAAFYDVLGEQRYTEQQVKLLFDLAAKASLVLNQGEYKAGYDQASRVSTYQIILPVKGQYQAIWQFAMQGLREMPFASLDEVSFRRDSISEPAVEARLRFTLYLKDGAP